jgi:signal peptidase I
MIGNNKEKKQQTYLESAREFIVLLLVVFLIRTFIFGLYQVPTGSMETTMLVGERFFADKLSYNFRNPQRGEIIAFNDPEYAYSNSYFMSLFQRYVWGPSNWTKRVIGVPGDTIMGVIEEGKPCVYRNGEKLDEPYINKYPLIRAWKRDQTEIYKSLDRELQKYSRGYHLDRSLVDQFKLNYLMHEIGSPRSYDPSVAYNEQPFYRFVKDRVICDQDGNPEMIVPGSPLPSASYATQPDTARNNWNRSDVFYITLGDDEYWCMGDNRLGSHDCRFFGPIKRVQIHGRILIRIWSMDSDESWWIIDLVKHPIDFWTRMRWSRFFQMMN